MSACSCDGLIARGRRVDRGVSPCTTVLFAGVKFRASEVAAATGGRRVGPDVWFEGASFDSRTLVAGQLFVPVVAQRDGHQFIRDALASGASGYLTSASGTRSMLPDEVAIEVVDTARALTDLASWARGRLTDQVVGITGSVGKTSTKDLVAAAVGAGRLVWASERSFNNDQGVPVTVLAAPEDTEVLVLEMGMRGFGEITRLCEVGRPTIGVVTTVGESHTERVGGIEGVARAKRELVEHLPAGGTAILNADDHRVAAMAQHTSAQVITFGFDTSAQVRISQLELDELARARFWIDSPWGRVQVNLAVSGRHMALNAAGAIAVAGVLGVDLEAAAVGLLTSTLSEMRMEMMRAAGGGLVINDAYNANPTSMAAAVSALASVPAARRIAVLGPMAELEDPAAAHLRVAGLVRAAGIELIAVGTDLYGVDPVEDPVSVVGSIGTDTAVLVKASRFAGLERIARALVAHTA
jgi:UDP-N-acetylmuramoyl-tripeptide--D-alanyl-D-alanine ligase